MEKLDRAQADAKKYVRMADHLLTQTYPLVKDQKLLIAVLDNIFLSLEQAITVVLYTDRLRKKIPPFHDTFESKFHVFQKRSAIAHALQEDANLVEEVKTLQELHKKSLVEFARKDAFIITAENYELHQLTQEKLRQMLDRTKQFVEKTKKIATHNAVLTAENLIDNERNVS